MKKITFLLLLVCASGITMGQSAFQRKDIFISAALNLGNYRTATYNESERYGNSVPLSANAEYGISNKFSVGPYGGYYSRKYKYVGPSSGDTQDDFTYTSHYTIVGVRGSYHFMPALEKKLKADMMSEDVDLYVSVLAGYEMNTLSGTRDINFEKKSKPVVGAVFGARYFVNYRFAFFGEVGPNTMGLGSLGITARF